MITRIKKISFYSLFLVLMVLMISMYYTISENKEKVEIYFKHNDKINLLMNYNNYFNSFLLGQKDFVVFDSMNKKINDFNSIIDNLVQEAYIFDMNYLYIKKLKIIKSNIAQKELWIERYKARKAFESKILFFILDKSSSDKANLNFEVEKQLNDLRIDLLRVIHLDRGGVIQLLSKYTLDKENYYLDIFTKQVEALQDNLNFQNKFIDISINKDIENNLIEIKKVLTEQRIRTKKVFFIILNILIFLIVVFTLVLIYFFIKLSKTKDQLGAFRKAVENSDNVIVMTDKNSNIIFANDAFEKVSGYSKDEALGENPKVLKSGMQDKNFYKELNETIYSGKTWKGRFINKKKDGELFYENATITPIFSDGNIDGYLAIKLDVTESVMHAQELDKLNKSLEKRVEDSVSRLREKDNLILNQTKMAALGEMIGNIAHQWRQPLSVISTAATGLQLEKQVGVLTDEKLLETCDTINTNAQYLSKTIDDFRNFIKGESKKEEFSLKEMLNSFKNLVESSVKKYQINLILDIKEDVTISSLRNELNQCLINLFNNSKDAMNEHNIEEKYIKINAFTKDDTLTISFIDNGGGIDENIINKIFDPYFTTKHQSIGTGLGLNMVYRLITEGMGGTISVVNEPFKVNDQEYYGAKFIIEIHLAN